MQPNIFLKRGGGGQSEKEIEFSTSQSSVSSPSPSFLTLSYLCSLQAYPVKPAHISVYDSNSMIPRSVFSETDPENELAMLGWVLLLPREALVPEPCFPRHQGLPCTRKVSVIPGPQVFRCWAVGFLDSFCEQIQIQTAWACTASCSPINKVMSHLWSVKRQKQQWARYPGIGTSQVD